MKSNSYSHEKFISLCRTVTDIRDSPSGIGSDDEQLHQGQQQ
jgi:hypothetical protein